MKLPDSPDFPRSPLGTTDPHVEAPAKPCCKRVRIGKSQGWCLLPDGHVGDCHGITVQEFPDNPLGPQRKWRW